MSDLSFNLRNYDAWKQPPDGEDEECPDCEGEDEECSRCHGTGYLDPEQEREDALERKAEDRADAARDDDPGLDVW